jgi:hypothetical protein
LGIGAKGGREIQASAGPVPGRPTLHPIGGPTAKESLMCKKWEGIMKIIQYNRGKNYWQISMIFASFKKGMYFFLMAKLLFFLAKT